MTLADMIRRCRRWRCECGATFPDREALEAHVAEVCGGATC